MNQLIPVEAGHWATRWPRLIIAIALMVTILAVVGLSQLRSNYSISSIFASDSAEYTLYESFRTDFPLNERDLIVSVRADAPYSREQLEAVRDLHLELQLLDAAEGAISVFSLTPPDEADAQAPPHFPVDLPAGRALQDLMKEVATHPIAGDRLLSRPAPDGQTAVIVVNLSAGSVEQDHLEPTVDQVRQTADELLEGTGLDVQLLGPPAMEYEIKRSSRWDRVTFNLAGLAVGTFISFVFFRSFRFVAITTIVPVLAVAWTFGAIGLSGMETSIFTNTVVPLVMVVAFANAMHLTYGMRRRLDRGETALAAIRETIDQVMPACILATATTGLAMLSLVLGGADAIRDFATAGAVGMLMLIVISLVVVPALGIILMRGYEPRSAEPGTRRRGATGLGNTCMSVSRLVMGRGVMIGALGLALTIIFAAASMQLKPQFRMGEQVPAAMQERMDTFAEQMALASANPAFVIVNYPQQLRFDDPAVVGPLSDLRVALAGVEQNLGTLSALDFAGRNADGIANLEQLPEPMRARFLNQNAKAHLITLYLPDVDSSRMDPILADVADVLAGFERENPDLSAHLTGLSVVSTLHATTIIPQLYRAMFVAIAVVLVLIGVFFRSFSAALFSVVPNTLPLVAVGALLAVLGRGIDYTGVIALTVAFGLAVDDTIHFLARYRLERNRGIPLPQAVDKTINAIGPVIIVTSIVLTMGILVTLLGEMPQTQLFGVLTSLALLVALVGDLVVLPATILAVHRPAEAETASAGAE